MFYRKTRLTEAYMFGDPDMPQEFINAICFENDYAPLFEKDGSVTPHIHTLEGVHAISVTDWIAKGVRGEFWPIKDDIFQETYELAEHVRALPPLPTFEPATPEGIADVIRGASTRKGVSE